MAIKKDYSEILQPSDIKNYLESKVDNSITSWDQIPGYQYFFGLKESVDMFIWALTNNKHIRFVHDSDVDGIGTYLITYGFLSHFMLPNCSIIITNRKEGYGFLPHHLEGMKEGDLIITADNGITSHPACDAAREKNINVIITDHHQQDEHRGKPYAFIINPHQDGCHYPYKDINGTFVYWFFISAIVDRYQINLNMKEYFLPELTLTTISDVMPLTGINRFIVKEGLKYMNENKQGTTNKLWLNTWLRKCKDPVITSDSLAFGFIPSLNATGRLTKAEETAFYMVESDPFKSNEWLEYINYLNDTRKQQQFDLKNNIEMNYGGWLANEFILIPGSKDWPKGILGPTAGGLAERFNKPAIVLKESDCGTYYSGSGRSVGEVNILGLLKNNQFIDQNNTGGHKAACGVKLKKEHLNNFYWSLIEETRKLDKKLFENTGHVLGKLDLADIDWNLFKLIDSFEPFGQGFKRPQFLVKAKLKNVTKSRDGKHQFLTLDDGLGTIMRAAWFNAPEQLKSGNTEILAVTIQHDAFKDPQKEKLILFVESRANYIDWED